MGTYTASTAGANFIVWAQRNLHACGLMFSACRPLKQQCASLGHAILDKVQVHEHQHGVHTLICHQQIADTGEVLLIL